MRTSEKGIEFIKFSESAGGPLLKAYPDSGGVWTIGYGHTKGVKKGDQITAFMADEYLKDDLRDSERAVEQYVTSSINQNQFDALVSFTFNLGPGNLKSSTLLKRVNADPNDPDIALQFQRWVYCNGVVLKGLVKRREREAAMYFGRPWK